MELPLGRWIRLNRQIGDWELKVTAPGAGTKTFAGLKNNTPKFEKLTWLGFTSNATETTVFYLDNIEIINES